MVRKKDRFLYVQKYWLFAVKWYNIVVLILGKITEAQFISRFEHEKI